MLDSNRNESRNTLKFDIFKDFYKYLNLLVPTEKEMNEIFKKTFKNSLEKGSHGFDKDRYVPD